MTELHSKYSASGFEAAMLCPGKPVMERDKPDSSSEYADEGAAAHTLLDWCLKGDKDAAAFKGRRIAVGPRTFEVDDAMVEPVQRALDNIRDIVGDGALLSEQRVVYGPVIGVGEGEGWGTSDVVAVRGAELQVHDLKYGRGVEVSAERNPQMMLYALGALAADGDMLGPFETVRMVIHQPRLKDAPDEWTCSIDDLLAWARDEAAPAVVRRRDAERMFVSLSGLSQPEWEALYLRPNEKSCKFCRAKATCPALRNEVAQTVTQDRAPASPDEFNDLRPSLVGNTQDADAPWLAAALSKVDLIEDWCKAVRAEVERRLLAGDEVPGFKLVEGRQGNRVWSDKAAVEKALKAMRLKVEEMYDLTLISPTTAEKLAKAKTIGPRQWKALQEHITRADAKKHVAPVSDPRPALVFTPAEDDFEVVNTEIDFA